MTAALALVDVVKSYSRGGGRVDAVKGVTFTIAHGEFVALMGPSGSGKSTLLNLIAGLDTPDAGEILLDETPLSALDDDARTDLRRSRIGVVFQRFNLLPSITALENVALPLRAAGVGGGAATARAHDALVTVGLGARAAHLPEELSGGEMQRVAIARW